MRTHQIARSALPSFVIWKERTYAITRAQQAVPLQRGRGSCDDEDFLGHPARICGGAALRSRCASESCMNEGRISEVLRIDSPCARLVPLASWKREASGAGKPNGWLVAPYYFRGSRPSSPRLSSPLFLVFSCQFSVVSQTEFTGSVC